MRTNKILPFEWQKLSFPLIAVDEVGRGCLAGPVVAAAVLVESGTFHFDERITDSKKLSPVKRKELSLWISAQCRTAIGSVSAREIDQINIHQASLLAMKKAVEGLQISQGLVLVDGKFKIPQLDLFEQIPLIKGDLRAQPIGAASIVAKVFRDEQMTALAEEFPQYGFEIHKGYATQLHRDALKAHGASLHHRQSFRGVLEEAPAGSPAGGAGRDFFNGPGL